MGQKFTWQNAFLNSSTEPRCCAVILFTFIINQALAAAPPTKCEWRSSAKKLGVGAREAGIRGRKLYQWALRA